MWRHIELARGDRHNSEFKNNVANPRPPLLPLVMRVPCRPNFRQGARVALRVAGYRDRRIVAASSRSELSRLAMEDQVTTLLSQSCRAGVRSLCSEISVIASGRVVYTGSTRELGADLDTFEERLVELLTQEGVKFSLRCDDDRADLAVGRLGLPLQSATPNRAFEAPPS
jgi:hypothetical protein